MFNRFLASIGIGNAKIDTVLEKSRYAPGEEVRGVVRMQGGSVDQRVETVQLSVMTEYIRETDDHKHRHHAEIARFHVTKPFTLQPNERQEVPFSFLLPNETPLTIGRAPVWIKTELDVRGAVDPGDSDRIEVQPSQGQHVVLEALSRIGFRLREAECQYAARLGGRLPFVQEFEFVPTTQFRGQLDELEVTFFNRGHELELLLQIDRKARGLGGWLSEAMDMDETFVRVTFSDGQLQQGPDAIAHQLADIIQRYV
ncbi:sporulation protein [Paenibacillus sp. MMS18-CY102]|uniref:sporulation protein n=1 Tax=Paenibacillus sp. MMS18-CY102 TaxID=2682849 RepID=UPI0013651CC6|nr:sporulation protein [Paenibacillus sp. MMS18-CY102]MWC27790.1 sporulation protein SpoOM [Paenibacillus sp. MMS18-CY102]